MPPPDSLSATAIQLYLTCSLKYRFQYVDRLPRLTLSENQAFGTAIHAALNWLHKARKRGHNPPLAEVLQVFEADWYAQTQAEGTKVQFDDLGDAAVLAYKGRELLTQYYHLPAGQVRDSEVWFMLPLVNPTTGEVVDVPLRRAMSEGDEKYYEAVARFKREFLEEALAAHNGNRTHTARTLGLQRTYLLRLLREFGLNQPGNGRRKLRAVSVSQ